MTQTFLGIDAGFSLTSVGNQEHLLSAQVGNHISCIDNGLIKYCKEQDRHFTEYLIEVDRNNYITNDDESLFSFGEIMQTIKKELIYVEV